VQIVLLAGNNVLYMVHPSRHWHWHFQDPGHQLSLATGVGNSVGGLVPGRTHDPPACIARFDHCAVVRHGFE
jgi:hypothetical protein